MAGGKKKKSLGNAKKNKSRRNGDGAAGDSTGNKGKKRPIPLEDVLTQAESAMEMSDLDTALQLFSYASGVLRSRVHAPSTTSSDSGVNSNINVHDNDRDKVTLSTVLGKMGEIKASNGDVEGARSNFLDAVELLDANASTALSMGTTGSDKMAVDEGGCNLDVAQSCERIAGLYLYLGQLSSGMEALTSFRTGVSELERAVCILERISAAATATDGVNDLAVAGCGDSVSLGRFLVETRCVSKEQFFSIVPYRMDSSFLFRCRNSAGDNSVQPIARLLNSTSQIFVTNLTLNLRARWCLLRRLQ
jgi:hypothetical protein